MLDYVHIVFVYVHMSHSLIYVIIIDAKYNTKVFIFQSFYVGKLCTNSKYA